MGVHGIDRLHHTGQVEGGEQVSYARDLVALRGDDPLPPDRPGMVEHGNRCGASRSRDRAPRTVLPSIAMTRRSPMTAVQAHRWAPITRSTRSASSRANARRIVDSSERAPHPERGKGGLVLHGHLLADRDERAGAGERGGQPGQVR